MQDLRPANLRVNSACASACVVLKSLIPANPACRIAASRGTLMVATSRHRPWAIRKFFSAHLMSEVTRILSAIERGDTKAADQLLPLVYDELRRLAAHQ